MKSKILLFAIALFTVGSTNAQVKSRLIGLTKAVYDGTSFSSIGDTAWYTYSGHNDTLNNGTLAYDTSYVLAYLGGYTQSNLSYRYFHTLDTHNNLATSEIQYFDTAATAWVKTEFNTFTYDTLNNMLHQVHQVWDATTTSWVNNTNTLNTYSGTNNTLKLFQLWNTSTSAWVNNTKDSFYYNTGGDMIYHLTQRWDTTALSWVNLAQVIDTYNTAHGIVSLLRQVYPPGSTSWINNAHSDYHYTSTGLLCNTISQRWDTTAMAWIGTSEDSIVYFGATTDKMHETRYRWDTTAHAFVFNTRDEFSYDANHNTLTDTTLRWNPAAGGSFVNLKLRVFSYNANNQVLVNTTASWSTSGAWYYKFTGGAGPGNGPDQQFRYYYEFNNVGVNNLAVKNSALAIYPNPASGNLNIKLQWESAQPFSLAIIDVKGNVVRQWAEQANKSYSGTIRTDELPEGMYLLRANTQSQQATQQFVIVR